MATGNKFKAVYSLNERNFILTIRGLVALNAPTSLTSMDAIQQTCRHYGIVATVFNNEGTEVGMVNSSGKLYT